MRPHRGEEPLRVGAVGRLLVEVSPIRLPNVRHLPALGLLLVREGRRPGGRKTEDELRLYPFVATAGDIFPRGKSVPIWG